MKTIKKIHLNPKGVSHVIVPDPRPTLSEWMNEFNQIQPVPNDVQEEGVKRFEKEIENIHRKKLSPQ